MSKVRIYKSVFDLLHQSIKNRYEEIALFYGHEIESKGAAYYGFGDHQNDTKSLTKILLSPKQSIKNDPSTNDNLYQYLNSREVKEYKNLSPKYLYNLVRASANMKDSYDTLDIDPIFLNIFCKFINYNGFEDFVNGHPSISSKNKKLQLMILDLGKGNLSEDKLATKYLAFYWSFLEARRKTLEIWINYYNKSNGQYPAKVIGLHATRYSENDGVIYEGSAVETPSCLSITLQEKKNNRPLTVIGYKGHIPVRDMDYIFCILTGISKFGYPFSVEAILCKLSDKQKNIERTDLVKNYPELSHIDFYLQVQRRNFRVPPRIVTDLNALKARGQLSKEASQFPGIYRLWSLDRDGGINQAKLEIKADYSIVLHITANNENFKRQRGLFSFNFNFNKLCISGHSEVGVPVMNYIFLDVNPDRDNHVGKGIFCGIGLNVKDAYEKSKLVGEYLVYLRDDEHFEPAILDEEELKVIISKNDKAKQAIGLLLSSERLFKRSFFIDRAKKMREHLKADGLIE